MEQLGGFMQQTHLGDNEASIHRRQFLRTVGLVGGTAVGLAALNPSEALAFTVKELEEKLHEVGTAAVKFNIAIGSGLTHNTGEKNIAIGHGALEANTSGSHNTVVGESALEKNTEGQRNVAVGYSALENGTTASENIAIGYQALSANDVAVKNTAVGTGALRNAKKGSVSAAEEEAQFGEEGIGGGYNTAVGQSALELLTWGVHNTSVGASSLESNKQGSNNSAFGGNALLANSTGNNNTAIGISAEEENTTGGDNTSVGKTAMEKNTTQSLNVAVGSEAMRYGVGTGEEMYKNTAIGYQAMRGEHSEGISSVKMGGHNTALGSEAMRVLAAGEKNVGVGANALESLSTGNANTAVGEGAGQGTTTGSNNVFIGFKAGSSATTTSNRLYVANSNTTEPLILGVFPNEEVTFNTKKIALYKGVTPVAQHATIAVPTETTAANTKAIKELIEAVKGIGVIK
jgi:hypothetical protein